MKLVENLLLQPLPLSFHNAQLPESTHAAFYCEPIKKQSYSEPHKIDADPKIARLHIPLPAMDERLVTIAKHLSEKLKAVWSDMAMVDAATPRHYGKTLERAAGSDARLNHSTRMALELVGRERKGKSALIKSFNAQTTLNRFDATLRLVLNQEGLLADFVKSPARQEIFALTALLSTNHGGHPAGAFLSRFPDGLFDGPTDHVSRRIGAIVRYSLVNGGHFTSAASLEGDVGLSQKLSDLHLGSLFHLFDARDLVTKHAFPGITEGRDPAVRDWLLLYSENRQGSEAEKQISAGMAHLIEFGLDAVVRPKSGGTLINFAKLKGVHWDTVLNKFSLRRPIQQVPSVGYTLFAVQEGIEFLTGNCGVGFGRNHITPKELGIPVPWRSPRGKELIAQLTENKVIEGICRSRHPELFSPHQTGDLNARAVREFSRFSEIFNEVATDCLRSTGLTIEEALKSVPKYRDLFGWHPSQIKPWEMRRDGMWQGKAGQRLLRKALAYSLWSEGCGKLIAEQNNLYFKVEKNAFFDWLESSDISRAADLLKIFITHKLSGGLKFALPSCGSMEETLRLLFRDEVGHQKDGTTPTLHRGKLNVLISQLFDGLQDPTTLVVALGASDSRDSAPSLFKHLGPQSARTVTYSELEKL